jgi:ribosomal protein S12 methylthiotransferase
MMADGRILPYLDIPFQHASANVLRAMRRPANEEKTLKRIEAWRRDVPDLAIRSSFIVGFPGETEEDFSRLLDWMSEAKIDRAGCFRYENVTGAASADLPGQVPEEVKDERWKRFMELQAQISDKRSRGMIGRTLDVIIDEVDDEGAVGRSKADAPEIDGTVFIDNGQQLKPGDIVRARITDADEYDLWGDI